MELTATNEREKKMKFTLTKLAHPIHSGDWHDRPGKWQVNGPESEMQTGFPTRKEAEMYAKCRRHSTSANEAGSKFSCMP